MLLQDLIFYFPLTRLVACIFDRPDPALLDPLRVVRAARLDGLPVKTGPWQVAVRVVDVFGFESEVVEQISDSNSKPERG